LKNTHIDKENLEKVKDEISEELANKLLQIKQTEISPTDKKNFSNIEDCFSIGIPIPVSLTDITTLFTLLYIFTSIFPPLGVNFIEFDNKFNTILSITSVSKAITLSSISVSKTIEIFLRST